MRRLFVATAIALLWVVILVLSLFAQAGPGSSPVSPSFTIPPFEPPAGSVITVTTGLDNLSDNGDCTLREAIQAANTDAAVDACPAGNGDDLILVPAGSYVLSLEGRSEDDNATGDLDIRSSLVISGAGSAGTIIDANQTDRVLHILTGTVAIRGVTVQNGRAADGKDDPCEPNGYEGCPGETGGGIANEGYLKIFESRVVGNKSGNGGYAVIGGDGGGIWNTGIFIAYDITLANNETGTGGWDAKWQLPNGRGGGIANLGTMTITNSQIRANSADQNRGGGVYNAGDAWFFA
ncbi:MAG TPA: CSLREA domain-containing protein, partial [Caldilineaceae bacterium]|nr:CSLREA domain-containing protein [Caldilineaceae bacterium]